MPPYLTAMWSVIATKSEAGTKQYEMFRNIYLDEMSHLGIACNLLAALGGSPSVTGEAVPIYPETDRMFEHINTF